MNEDNLSHVFQIQLGVDLRKNLSLEKVEGMKQVLEVDTDEEVTEAYLKFILSKIESAVAKQGFTIVDGRLIDLAQMGSQDTNAVDDESLFSEEPAMASEQDDMEEPLVSDNHLELINHLMAAEFEVAASGGSLKEIKVNSHYQVTPEALQKALENMNNVKIIVCDMEYDWELVYLDINGVEKKTHSHEILIEED